MEQTQALKALLEDQSLETVLILPHNMPDGDTLGSCIGVYHLIKQYNKKGYIVLNDDIPSNLSFLFEGELKCVKSDDVSDVAFDICIAVDAGETKLFEDREPLFRKGKHTVCIDHHKTNTHYAALNIVVVEASSTGEIVYMLTEELGCTINGQSAEGLYAAIVTDTGSFRYSNTRPLTFSICEKLVATGFDFNRLNVEIYQNKSYEKLLLLNRVFETLKLYCDGKCAVVKLSKQLIDLLALSEYDTDGIVEFVRDISGVEVVVFIRHLYDHAHKVSMRSKYNFDVSEIALAFKGGGHTKAAGFKSDDTIENIESKLVEAISKALN